MKTILITGASGFLGRELINYLKLLDDYIILTTDLKGDCDYLGDLSDINFVRNLPSVNIIINCAAVQYVSKPLPFLFRKSFFKKNNITAMENLYNRYGDNLEQFIHVGTSMMYEQNGSLKYEVNSKFYAQGVYSESKLAQQFIMEKFNCIKSTVIPCIIGGPGRRGLFVGFVKNILRFGLAILPGPCHNKTSIVHVKDVCTLIIKILSKRASGLYNAAPVDNLSIYEWANLTGNKLGKRVKIICLPLGIVRFFAWLTCYRVLALEQVLMLTYPHVLDNQSSLDLGWEPQYNTAEVIGDLVSSLINESGTYHRYHNN